MCLSPAPQASGQQTGVTSCASTTSPPLTLRVTFCTQAVGNWARLTPQRYVKRKQNNTFLSAETMVNVDDWKALNVVVTLASFPPEYPERRTKLIITVNLIMSSWAVASTETSLCLSNLLSIHK